MIWDPPRCCLITQSLQREDNRKSRLLLLGLKTKSWEAEGSEAGSASNLRTHSRLRLAENELVSCSLEEITTAGPGAGASRGQAMLI